MKVFGIILFIVGLITTKVKCMELLPETNAVAPGEFPYFAMIYFMDDSVRSHGYHFLRAGTLLKSDLVVSASIDKEGDEEQSYPKKTLLVRMGRITTKNWSMANPDDGEQEREVIKIFRPAEFNTKTWWLYDITALTVLAPFEMTSLVNVAPRPPKHFDYAAFSQCTAIVFQENEQDVLLVKLEVRLLFDEEICGVDHEPDKMLCSTGSDFTIGAGEVDGHCLANSGGPLICNDTVIATQSYKHPICNPPNFYHRLDYWNPLIECAIANDCQSKECEDVCIVTDKDAYDIESGSSAEAKDSKSKNASITPELMSQNSSANHLHGDHKSKGEMQNRERPDPNSERGSRGKKAIAKGNASGSRFGSAISCFSSLFSILAFVLLVS